MLDRIKNEPVLLLAVAGAVLTCLVQFGVDISSDQQNAVTGVVWAVLAVVARGKVSPVRKARGEHGAMSLAEAFLLWLSLLGLLYALGELPLT